MEMWYTEKQTPSVSLSLKTTKTLHVEQTEFQHLAMIETEAFGRMLVLDGMVQTSVVDEFVYHEMIAHPALYTHPNPKNVLVIGGGDGGTIREIIKHPSVEKATLVEIDGRIIELSKQYLPEIAVALTGEPKVEVKVEDGIKHINESKNTYDVILVDSTEPVGPAVGLFSQDFYQGIYDALKEDGLMVAQTESPFFNGDLITSVNKRLRNIFPYVKTYLASIPTYPSGLWSFTMGSKKYKIEDVDINNLYSIETKYFTPELMLASTKLPKFVQDLVKGE
ncbi:spermidine synthase [Anaerobranca californiensis DSM 14826]|jgi:spermidine synthase|uniref:Polyamine aminopropyltransferase n=1 Tax=Anaerobranca californiensis DSM 14826 TaxID=1120989 RepID=A0A1M6M712_9FIRM|nr:polyamine aminopropyltransferase [Anaerobranca californiensis]SHJ79271.1 spermidine synthase [Anaerobranca californiensis DSM 14826]